MSGYHGDLNVKEGTMNINQSLAGDAKISVSDGATLNLKEVELSSQSRTISVADSDGNLKTVTLPERDGSLVAEAGSNVTAKTITLKDKSSMKVDTGATVTADSVAVKDDATLSTAAQSKLNAAKVSVDPTKEGNVQLRGDFTGALTDNDGNTLISKRRMGNRPLPSCRGMTVPSPFRAKIMRMAGPPRFWHPMTKMVPMMHMEMI